MKLRYLLTIALVFVVSLSGFSNQKDETLLFNNSNLEVYAPIIVKGINFNFTLNITDKHLASKLEGDTIILNYRRKNIEVVVFDGKIKIPDNLIKPESIHIKVDEFEYYQIKNPIPLWFSILPPLIAILIALLLKEVFTALFIGILVGTTTIWYYQGVPFFVAIFKGIFSMIDTYILDSLTDHGHISIIVFSMLIGAMVNVITRNGGMKGIVNKLSKYANTPRSGQIVTWILGIAIFFDDYANTLVVGNTMRPVTDKLKISREKLAYIVDSTAAPIAAIAFVTTWIGAELSYIQDGINTIGLNESAYTVFLNSLKYSFYPIFTLVFILMLVWKRRDFGPMFRKEEDARTLDFDSINNDEVSFSNKINDLEIPEHIKAKWYNAAIPVGIVIIGTIIGLITTGWDQSVWENPELKFTTKLSAIIGNADSYLALLWSSMLGLLAAITLTIGQKILNLKDTIDSMINGFRTMLTAILILTLAWSIALVTEHLHTADFISQILVDINIGPYFIPALTFILSALVAFSTGSSWGTMAILYPLILPATWLISTKSGLDYDTSISIFYNVVSSVLAGSVLGDHCSPISDTTILSSLASSCNHIEHVRTQLPYALTVGFVAIFIGTIPAAYGVPSVILIPLGIAVLFLIIHFFGKKLTIPDMSEFTSREK